MEPVIRESVLKEVKYGERVYLTRNGVGECAIINMKELDKLDKMVALRGLMKDLDRAKARADREGWIDADEAVEVTRQRKNDRVDSMGILARRPCRKDDRIP